MMIPKNGRYAIGVRFSNRDSNETKIKLIVNGQETVIFAPNTQYDDTYFINWAFVDLYIKPNNAQNIVEVKCDSAIYIDCVVLDYLDHK